MSLEPILLLLKGFNEPNELVDFELGVGVRGLIILVDNYQAFEIACYLGACLRLNFLRARVSQKSEFRSVYFRYCDVIQLVGDKVLRVGYQVQAHLEVRQV